jgi:ribosomal protein L18E
MITKTKFWQEIKKELIEAERSKRIMLEIMKIVKDTPQDENKD